MNKIKIYNKWGLICGSSSVDVNTNLLSVFSVIDEITVSPPKKPLPPLPPEGISIAAQHDFVSVWSRNDLEERKVNAILRYRNPDNVELLKKDIVLSFEKGKKNLRLILKFNGFKLKLEGEYRYEIELTDERVEPLIIQASFLVKFSK